MIISKLFSPLFLFAGLLLLASCGNAGPATAEKPSELKENKEALIKEKTTSTMKQADKAPDSNAIIQTIKNMLAAYQGEITATARYTAYSKKAEAEGFHEIAVLYKAVSIAESIHSINHKSVLEDAGARIPVIKPAFAVKSTKENLANDIGGEAYEATTMYPEYLASANEAGNEIAFTSLSYAMKTEKKHKIFYEKALGDINSNTLQSLPSVYFVCPVCGNTYERIAPKHCDFSMTAGDRFFRVD
jgi:rubrerythrin